MTLDELERRLQEATEPDREIDFDIKRALSPRTTILPLGMIGSTAWLMSAERADPIGDALAAVSSGSIVVEPYTASLDAAVALCERVFTHRHDWQLSRLSVLAEGDQFAAKVYPVKGGYHSASEAFGKTPALALCLAIVRALRAPTPTDKDRDGE